MGSGAWKYPAAPSLKSKHKAHKLCSEGDYIVKKILNSRVQKLANSYPNSESTQASFSSASLSSSILFSLLHVYKNDGSYFLLASIHNKIDPLDCLHVDLVFRSDSFTSFLIYCFLRSSSFSFWKFFMYASCRIWSMHKRLIQVWWIDFYDLPFSAI